MARLDVASSNVRGGFFPNIGSTGSDAGRYQGAIAEKAVPFPSVARRSQFFFSSTLVGGRARRGRSIRVACFASTDRLTRFRPVRRDHYAWSHADSGRNQPSTPECSSPGMNARLSGATGPSPCSACHTRVAMDARDISQTCARPGQVNSCQLLAKTLFSRCSAAGADKDKALSEVHHHRDRRAQRAGLVRESSTAFARGLAQHCQRVTASARPAYSSEPIFADHRLMNLRTLSRRATTVRWGRPEAASAARAQPTLRILPPSSRRSMNRRRLLCLC
jgi:hypothetical protein